LKRYDEAVVAFKHLPRTSHPPGDIEYEFFTDLCSSKLSSQENEQYAFYNVLNTLNHYEGKLCNIRQDYSHDPHVIRIQEEFKNDPGVIRIQEEFKKLLVLIDQVLALDSDYVPLWCLKGLVLY